MYNIVPCKYIYIFFVEKVSKKKKIYKNIALKFLKKFFEKTFFEKNSNKILKNKKSILKIAKK